MPARADRHGLRLRTPKLVIADEPTTALDVTVQAQIVTLIRELQVARLRTAIVFITHDLRLAGQICDDLLVLYAGRPVETGARYPQIFADLAPSLTRAACSSPPPPCPARAARLFGLRGQMPGLREIATIPRLPLRSALPRGPARLHRMSNRASKTGAACFHPQSHPNASPCRQALASTRRLPTTTELLRADDLGRVFVSRGLFRKRETVAAENVSVSYQAAANSWASSAKAAAARAPSPAW